MQAEYWGISEGKYLQVATSSGGQTTIKLSEVVAWHTSNEYEARRVENDIHMKSGTIFTFKTRTDAQEKVALDAFMIWTGGTLE
tara:strand:+ start:224 stop:475 length:252 start_codon:yes stop_codon:yes gene_type:complete